MSLLSGRLPQLIKFRLDELDKQTEAITEHVNKLSSILPTKEDEASLLACPLPRGLIPSLSCIHSQSVMYS